MSKLLLVLLCPCIMTVLYHGDIFTQDEGVHNSDCGGLQDFNYLYILLLLATEQVDAFTSGRTFWPRV